MKMLGQLIRGWNRVTIQFPVRVPVFVMRLAELKAKPNANHTNPHPMQDWSCQICNQHRATSPARGSGFKFDTTRTNLARPGVTYLRISGPRFWL
jgi:hypothetical protein